jgi:hypothetical protein
VALELGWETACASEGGTGAWTAGLKKNKKSEGKYDRTIFCAAPTDSETHRGLRCFAHAKLFFHHRYGR